MIKVLAFDSWTGGIVHYARLIPALRSQNCGLTLVHIGSWGVDTNRPKEEELEGVLVRDISYYPNGSFQRVLEIEKPSVVLFLSTQTFAHRAFIRFCRIYNVPTVHLTHGIFATMNTESGRLYSYNLVSYLFFLFSRLNKMLTKTWPVYIYSLFNTRAGIRDYQFFIRDNLNLIMGRDAPLADDTITDICLIYTEADRYYALKNFRFVNESIRVVGNPDIERFGLEEKLINSFTKEQFTRNNDIMYIDTSLILRGAVFRTVSHYIQHLTELSEDLNRMGKHLVVKLHPNFDKTDIPLKISAAGIDICSHSVFVERLTRCSCVITEASTAALIPAYMGMPLFLAQFGSLSTHSFGTLISQYPRATLLNHVIDLNNYFQDPLLLVQFLNKEVGEWIDLNIGPLPINQMPHRVVREILYLVGRYSHN